MGYRNVNYLIIIYLFTKWTLIDILNNKTIAEINNWLDFCFSCREIPNVDVKNAVPLNRFRFMVFGNERDFEWNILSSKYCKSKWLTQVAVRM